MSPQGRHRARKGEGDLLRDEIIAAAERLLAATGDEEAVSVRAVAREAGCTPPAIYLHFDDRRALLFAVCERHFTALDAAVTAAVDGVDDPVEALRRAGRAYLRWGIENPEPYRLIFMVRREETPPFRFEGDRAGETAFGHLVELVERAMDAGALTPRDPFLVASGLWAAVHGVTSLVISTPRFPVHGVDALSDHVTDVHLRGLGADRQRSPTYRSSSTA